uniref:hypothetical protein n=1 Tax=Prevotella sp. TaxID=59823 RepID=UPI00307CBEAD
CRFASKIPLNPIGCGFEDQIKCKDSEMIAYKQYISNVLIFVRFKLARKSKQNIKFYYLQANILWRDVI